MGTHEILFPLVVKSIRGEKVEPYDPKGGSINYKMMFLFTKWAQYPTEQNYGDLLGFLSRMNFGYHLTTKNGDTYVSECGSPGMHFTFNIAPVAGAYKKCLEIGVKADGLAIECLHFLQREFALDRFYRYKGVTVLPCPRVKDQKNQAPVDDYRNVFVALLNGEKVNKKSKYWNEDQAIAVSTIKGLVDSSPAFRNAFKNSAMPSLIMPITHIPTEDGYIATIAETTESRYIMGNDCCHKVHCSGGVIEYFLDWRNVPAGQLKVG